MANGNKSACFFLFMCLVLFGLFQLCQRFLVHDDAVYAHAADAFTVFDDDHKGHVTREVRGEVVRSFPVLAKRRIFGRLELRTSNADRLKFFPFRAHVRLNCSRTSRESRT